MGSRQEHLLELLDRFQEAEEDGRPVSVEGLCADCPDLKDELRERVELHRRLNEWAGRDAPATLPAEAEAAPGLPTIPGYKLLRELGRGGMGVVFEARHHGLNRAVAVKVLLGPDLAGPEALARFRGEAQTLACLQHPNVVQVFDSGEQDGRPFFVMELVRGGSLKERMTGAPLPPARAAALVTALARAVQAAHERGVIHRDLKPANVLLERSAGEPADAAAWGTPKVGDFGLAKRAGTAAERTRTGAVLGTPSYMAPEQARGDRDVGPAADVYALGAILYECLTGRPPFRGETPLDTIHQVLGLDPVPPRRLQPTVPRDLGVICLKCLEKDPARRYPSAAALADDVERFLGGRPIQARPPAAPERLWKWARRHPVAALTVAAAAALLVGLAIDLWIHQRNNESLRRALADATEANTLSRRYQGETNAALYASDVRLADQLLQAGDVFHLAEILDRHVPPEGATEDRRGFEWWLLRQRASRITASFQAHAGRVGVLEYLSDGRLVTGLNQWDKAEVAVWDSLRQVPISRRPVCHEGSHPLTAVARDGGLLAWVGEAWEHVRLWDAAAGKELPAVRLPTPVKNLALSPDGTSLATAIDGRVVVWDPRTGKERFQVPTWQGQGFMVTLTADALLVEGTVGARHLLRRYDLTSRELLAEMEIGATVGRWCSPRGGYLLELGRDKAGRLFDYRSRLPLHVFDVATAMAMSPDDQTLALAVGDRVELYEVNFSDIWRTATFRWQHNPIDSLRFSPDGKTLAAGTQGGMVYELNVGARHAPEYLPYDNPYGDAIATCPNGAAVATADGTVRQIDFRTGNARTALTGCGRGVSHIACCPHGRSLAVAWHERKDVGVWDLKTGRPRLTLKAEGPVRGVWFAPDGRTIALADGEKVSFRDPDTGAAVGHAVQRHGENVPLAVFAQGGKMLVTAGDNLCVYELKDAGTPRHLAFTFRPPTPLVGLAVSGDGRTVATQEQDGTVHLWKLSPDGKLTPDGAPLRDGGASRVNSGLLFSQNGKALLSLHDEEVKLWSLPGRTRVQLLGTRCRGVLSGDGNTLALASVGTVHLWDANSWRRRSLGSQPHPVHSLAYSPGGTTLLAGSRPLPPRILGGTRFHESTPLAGLRELLRSWSLAAGREVPFGIPDEMTPSASTSLVAWSARGLAAAAGEDGSVRVWDVGRGRLLYRNFVDDAFRARVLLTEFGRNAYAPTKTEYSNVVEGARALAFSRDGRWLAASGSRGAVRVWNAEDGGEYWRIKDGTKPVEWVGFHPDGRRLAVAQEGALHLYDLAAKRREGSHGDRQAPSVLCAAHSPDGSLLAGGGGDGIVRVWDLRSGAVRYVLRTHQSRVAALAFSPDGKTLASGSGDHSVRLWSVAVGQEVAVLRANAGPVGALAFAPDGRALAAGTYGGAVVLWRLPRR